jgi:hypothetical protein
MSIVLLQRKSSPTSQPGTLLVLKALILGEWLETTTNHYSRGSDDNDNRQILLTVHYQLFTTDSNWLSYTLHSPWILLPV